MVRVQVLLGSHIVTPTHTLPVPLLLPTWVSIPLTISRQERIEIYHHCMFTSLSHTQQGKGGYQDKAKPKVGIGIRQSQCGPPAKWGQAKLVYL